MQNKGENIFTKIVSRKLRERAFEAALGANVKCLLKIENGDLYIVKAVSRSGSSLSIECKDGFNELSTYQGIFSFDIGDEKYFLRSEVTIGSKNYAKVATSAPLFKLQRRSNFRVSLPQRFGSEVELSKDPSQKFSINDVSVGGLSFDIPMDSTLEVSQDEKITGSFKIFTNVSFDFTAFVKHIRTVGSMGSGLRRVGIQFDPLEPGIENKLLEVLIKIQKEDVSRSGESLF